MSRCTRVELDRLLEQSDRSCEASLFDQIHASLAQRSASRAADVCADFGATKESAGAPNAWIFASETGIFARTDLGPAGGSPRASKSGRFEARSRPPRPGNMVAAGTWSPRPVGPFAMDFSSALVRPAVLIYSLTSKTRSRQKPGSGLT